MSKLTYEKSSFTELYIFINNYVGQVLNGIYWPDNREFFTRSAEFWNRWIRLSCNYKEYKSHVHWIHM